MKRAAFHRAYVINQDSLSMKGFLNQVNGLLIACLKIRFYCYSILNALFRMCFKFSLLIV